ncbi:MAG: glutamate--tRNA ligase [Nanoarchaeota archaeon]|nr:glutamate--tRNA ligase [Nanoarchaeota archaeon]
MGINRDIIKAYALENAIGHDGKANQNSVLNSLFMEGLKKEEIKETMPIIQDVLKEIHSYTLEKQEKEFEELKELVKKREKREGLAELENAEKGKVVMRIAPFPSGPLHIGNTRQIILNDEYTKMYSGKLLLVLDDTIGSVEKPIEPEAYKMIEEGVKWLGVSYDKKIIYKSDRLEIYYEYAEELIKKGYMYVCSCDQEKLRENRERGIECDCRNLSETDNLDRWKKMFSAKEGEYAVRLKTDMQDKNPAFRDRIMFRISERTHPRVKNKYKVWPLLEFSWAIDDHLLGITHIIRGVELIMETQVEGFIWDIFKWKKPVTMHTGLFSIEGVKISKSKGAKEVRSGSYIGWNDPRTWSLQSLRDRGIFPETIREFILAMGMTKNNSTVAIDILYSLNKKFLEKVPRYFFVPDQIKVEISGSPELKAVLPLHPSENLGARIYKTSQEFYIAKKDYDNFKTGDYRLIHLLNFKVDRTIKGADLHFISTEHDEKLDVKFLQWLAVSEDNIKVDVRMEDNSIISGLGEPELLNLKEGTQIQFERFGFVKLHKLDVKAKKAEFWFTHR